MVPGVSLLRRNDPEDIPQGEEEAEEPPEAKEQASKASNRTDTYDIIQQAKTLPTYWHRQFGWLSIRLFSSDWTYRPFDTQRFEA